MHVLTKVKTMETFIEIKDFPDYSVSNLGNVRSNRTGRILKPDIMTKLPYRRVTLSVKGVTTRKPVHRLVAETFINNPLNKPYVNHIDNDPANNVVSNLEWVTHSENMLHCTKQGRGSSSAGALGTAKAKRAKRELQLKETLGNLFVSINAGKKSTVTFLCAKCMQEYTVRIDSPSLLRHNPMCRSCAYTER